jgi:hypothetical protein
MPFPEATRQILRYDEGRGAGWRDGERQGQIFFLRWNPGRTAIHLAQNHTPDVCLSAAGHTLKTILPQENPQWFAIQAAERSEFSRFLAVGNTALDQGDGHAGQSATIPRGQMVKRGRWHGISANSRCSPPAGRSDLRRRR